MCIGLDDLHLNILITTFIAIIIKLMINTLIFTSTLPAHWLCNLTTLLCSWTKHTYWRHE